WVYSTGGEHSSHLQRRWWPVESGFGAGQAPVAGADPPKTRTAPDCSGAVAIPVCLTANLRTDFLALLLQLFALFLEHRLAAELDLVAFERQHLHQDLVAFLQLVADFANAVFRNLADVQQAVGAGEDLDKRAEVHQPD